MPLGVAFLWSSISGVNVPGPNSLFLLLFIYFYNYFYKTHDNLVNAPKTAYMDESKEIDLFETCIRSQLC